MNKIVYLCGPINGCTDEECKDWREYAKKLLTCATLNPMDRDYRGRELESVNEIVEGDKADIEDSTHLLVNYEKPSVGTSMEILYAWEHCKKIIVVAREGTVISPWLKYHCDLIVHSFEEAIRLINEN